VGCKWPIYTIASLASELAGGPSVAKEFFDAGVVAFAGGADAGHYVGSEAEADMHFRAFEFGAAAAFLPAFQLRREYFAEGDGAGEIGFGQFGVVFVVDWDWVFSGHSVAFPSGWAFAAKWPASHCRPW
jgi:hypothetical protein